MHTEHTQTQDRPEVSGAALPLFKEALEKAGRARMRARGSSMRPSISDGDFLVIRRCAAGELLIGDIAACEREGSLVIHRLVGGTGSGLVLKGDALGRPDAPVPPGNLLGRVEVIESARGNLYLDTPAARALNAATLIYMLPVSALLAAWGRLREGRAPAPVNGAAKRLRAAAEWAPRFAASKLSTSIRRTW